MLRRSSIVLIALLLLAGAVAACNSKNEDGGQAAGPSSPAYMYRLGSVCERMFELKELRPFRSSSQFEGELDNKPRFDREYCRVLDRTSTPWPGQIRFEIRAAAVSRKSAEDEREKLSGGGDFSDLVSCPPEHECWLDVPDCSIDPGTDPALRGTAATALSGRYLVEITIGLLPDDRSDLCDADRWSENLAVKVLQTSLDHLRLDHT